MFNPRISVVVLTHNRIARLLDSLKHLRALPERPRIIVADNASEDGTALLIGLMFPDVLLVPCKSDLGAAARNWAVGCVQTEYVAFCDDDTQWTPGSLDQASEPIVNVMPRLKRRTTAIIRESKWVGIQDRSAGCAAAKA